MHCTTAVWVSCPPDRVFRNGTHHTSTWTDPPTLPSALWVPRSFESLRERMTSDAGEMGGRRDGGVESRTRLLRRGPGLLDLCCQTDSNAVDVMDSAVSRRTRAGLRNEGTLWIHRTASCCTVFHWPTAKPSRCIPLATVDVRRPSIARKGGTRVRSHSNLF